MDHFRSLGGGSSDEPAFDRFVVQLGLLMGFTAVVAIILHFLKQSTIVSYIIVGIVMKQVFNALDVTPDVEILNHFSHVGIILLLFMAGLEVDIAAFVARAKLVTIVGLGQIVINTVMGMIVGVMIIGDMLQGAMGIVYFGLCTTFSSTIVVLGMLKRKKQLESLHGQICLGLLVFQDITAVLSLAILNAAGHGAPWDTCEEHFGTGGNTTSNATISEDIVRRLGGGGGGSDKPLGEALGFLVLWLIVFSILQYLSSRFVLQPLFRELSSSSELMFLGTLGYALLSAGIADAVDFSPEIAAFLAGVSMTVLPYKLEIEDKVESIKNLGIVTFFITLGMDLNLDIKIGYYLASIVIAVVIIFFTMGILVILGVLAKMKARPTFMIGGIVNQISEFSLILASLCVEQGVFCQAVLTILAIGCVLTIIVSGIGHELLEPMWMRFGKKYFKFLDNLAVKVNATALADSVKLEDHVVCFGINKLTEMVATYAHEKLGKEHILVIDIDADLINAKSDHKIIRTLYADMFDPDTWAQAKLDKAMLVVSCLEEGQEAELQIGMWMKERNGTAFYITTTEEDHEAMELYDGGSNFVIHTEELATMKLQELMEQNSLTELKALGEEHLAKLEAAHNMQHGSTSAVHPESQEKSETNSNVKTFEASKEDAKSGEMELVDAS